MNFQITEIFIEEIKLLIKEKKEIKIKSLLEDKFPQDIAEIISKIDLEDGKYLFELLKNKSPEIFIELGDKLREKILLGLSTKKIAKNLIENLESDDAVDLIQDMSDPMQKEVLSQIKNQKYIDSIEDLLSYPDNSAGALMGKELIKVNKKWSVIRCLGEMRKQAENIDEVYTIYVVDKFEKLLGTVSLKKLLITPEKTFIEKIYNKNIISVSTDTEDENVVRIMNKYDLIVLPVTDKSGKLVGRITIDDVVDVMKEEAEKDYQMASGITKNVDANDNIIRLIKARIPWLIIGLIGGIIGSKIIHIFLEPKDSLQLAFIPLIAAMAGNIGVQSAAIVVQDIASNNLKDKWVNKFIKELSVSAFNGLICGIIIFIFCYLNYGLNETKFSISLSISLVVVMIYAAIFGTFIPLLLNKFRIDPALATGPFITTMNDVIGLLIYFIISEYIFT
tara:strand:- start:16132 stop:17478 length:1347 start_codon:yes stop_codon:yes gene_type:complete